MYAVINAIAVVGIEGFGVRVEVDHGHGMNKTYLVGLPDGAIRESLRRVEAAMANSGFAWPPGTVTINLSPAGIRKDGTGFDLPIALAVLIASEQIVPDAQRDLERVYVVGELSLDGSVLPVPGVLPRAARVRDLRGRQLLTPPANASEAAVVREVEVIPIDTLTAAAHWLRGEAVEAASAANVPGYCDDSYPFDLAEVRGQAVAKRALEIAAAGGHNTMMVGPPGSGKTMLARRMVTILPPLTSAEAIETTTVYSVAGALPAGTALMRRRPFCAPHFTISSVGLAGGGSGIPRPGQVSLAHNGVLFLDELPEFRRSALEVLRGPLEDKQVTLTRAMVTVTYPASVMVVAAMNPCPCGFFGTDRQRCTCSYGQVQAYRCRLSGPLLDRFDLHTLVAPVAYADLVGDAREAGSQVVRDRVVAARQVQDERLQGEVVHCNAEMEAAHLTRFCDLDAAGHRLVEHCVDVLGLSARGVSRLLKVSRTIADLAASGPIREEHLAEAVSYRRAGADPLAN